MKPRYQPAPAQAGRRWKASGQRVAISKLAAAIRHRSPGFAVCAIAGIDASNAADTITAGADGIAVISALSRGPDPMLAARELRAVVDTALAQRRQS